MQTTWSTTEGAGRTTVHVLGDLDLLSAPELRAHLAETLEHCQDVLVVDLTEVPFCDSSGLSPLVATLRLARRLGRELVLVAAPGSRVHRFLQLAGVLGLFTVEPGPGERSSTPPAQASKSSVTAGVDGWDWQASTKPAATSSGSSA